MLKFLRCMFYATAICIMLYIGACYVSLGITDPNQFIEEQLELMDK